METRTTSYVSAQTLKSFRDILAQASTEQRRMLSQVCEEIIAIARAAPRSGALALQRDMETVFRDKLSRFSRSPLMEVAHLRMVIDK